MIRYCLDRPIAVIMSTLALIILSALSLKMIPVRLLPGVDAPRIILRYEAPGMSAEEIEQYFAVPLRFNIGTLPNIKSLESTVQNQQFEIRIEYTFGTNMEQAFISLSEKLSVFQINNQQRIKHPRIFRENSTEIPLILLHISSDNHSLGGVTDFASKIAKRQIEQIQGVATVLVKGGQSSNIVLRPKLERLKAFDISEIDIMDAISMANIHWGALVTKEGQSQYFVRINSALQSIEDVGDVLVDLPNGDKIPISELVSLSKTIQNDGYHLLNQRRGVYIAIYAQEYAQIPVLRSELQLLKQRLARSHPRLEFSFTRDRTDYLFSSIQNLEISLVIGGFLVALAILLTSSSFRVSLIVCICLPIAIVISILPLYLSGTSLNIISISGVILGLGLLIDNSIIVVDNIGNFRDSRISTTTAVVEGTSQVIQPLLTSILTTLAVFIPLIFIGGLPGELFMDQAISVACILIVSFFTAVILLPVLYQQLITDNKTHKPALILAWLLKVYNSSFAFIWRRKKTVLLLSIVLILTSIPLIRTLEFDKLPNINSDEYLLLVAWNEDLTTEESLRRNRFLISKIQTYLSSSEINVGESIIENSSVDKSFDNQLLLKLSSTHSIATLRNIISDAMDQYPFAKFKFEKSKNLFDLIFDTPEPFVEFRIRDGDLTYEQVLDTLTTSTPISFQPGEGFQKEIIKMVSFRYDMMNVYGVDRAEIIHTLKNHFAPHAIAVINNFNQGIGIYLERSALQSLEGIYLHTSQNQYIALSKFVNVMDSTQFKFITADKRGKYKSVIISNSNSIEHNFSSLDSYLENFRFDQVGSYLSDKSSRRRLIQIIIVSVILVYFILAAQFESLTIPLLVMIVIPVGILGSLVFLWLSDSNLNTMAVLGVLVMIGISLNDSILKADTIQRLFSNSSRSIDDSIIQAGKVRLRPIILTTLTTVLAVSPFLFSSGLGSDLQRPFAIAIIGGMISSSLSVVYLLPILSRFQIWRR